MHRVEYHRNYINEFRNCQNTWMYDEKLNNFLAISDIEMLGIGDEHHGPMSKNKSCALVNTFVCDIEPNQISTPQIHLIKFDLWEPLLRER